MTTSGDTTNKTQRRVLTIKTVENNKTANSLHKTGNANFTRHNTVVIASKKDNNTTQDSSKEIDFSFEKRKMRNLSSIGKPAMQQQITETHVPVESVQTQQADIQETKQSVQPKTENQKPYQHYKKRTSEVNFNIDAKKKFKNLNVSKKEEKPQQEVKSIENKEQKPDHKTVVSVKQIELNKKKVVSHPKQKSFDDEVIPVVAKKPIKQSNFRISVAQLARIDSDDFDSSFTRSHKRKRKSHSQQQVQQEKVLRDIIISDVITVSDLAMKMSEKGSTVIKTLMKLGVMATINQTIDADTAELVATELGHRIQRVTEESIMKDLIADEEENETQLEKRSPIVTVMGHVDHGKTSLLDALRKTDIAAKEHGGITQHIGAHEVHLPNGESITFLDTPGHEAFSAMRMRGAKVTDIIILVVAADDGIKAQTVEAISHAKAAGVPIIVAINKMDKPAANFDAVKQSLLQYEIIPDDFGGDVMVIGISAITRQGLNELIDAILLQADLLNLKANPSGRAKGYIVEARLDKIKGYTASLLVQKGQLKIGDIIVAGHVFGRIRTMHNDKGESIKIAGPSVPVEITGLDSVPVAGDQFTVMQNEKSARELVEMLVIKAKTQKFIVKPKTLHEMFIDSREVVKEIPIIVKADVHGSAEAILHSLNKIEHSEVKVKVIHYGAGGINESDVMLAAASKAFIVGFNVRPNANAKEMANKMGIEMKFYSVIYHLIDDVKAVLTDALSPIERENVIGLVEIRKVFDTSKYGKIAGCYVKEGIIRRNVLVRLIRDNSVIHTGAIQSLKRQKDDVKEVKEGFECGITLDRYDDIRTGDTLEVFETISEKKTL